MEHYLAHTDYPIWEVIQRGNGPVSVLTDTNGVIKVLPPKTAEEILARERERKARTTLLMALPEDHLAKFHKITNAKEIWEAIKSRFGGNDESKKMQKFQSLMSQLEIHGAGVSTEDANQKFLRVFESDVKGSTASSSSTQNVAFVSENTSSTNDVSTAYGISNSFGHNSQCEHPSSYSFHANQSSCPQLDHEDLKQLDEFDLEEMDLKWQVAIISMRMKKFYKKTGRKLQFDAKESGNQDSRRRDAWNTENKDKDNGRRSGKQEESKALVTLDGEGVDWTSYSEDKQENYTLMAYSSSGSDTKMSARDKAGLGTSDIEDSHVNDRYAEGMHAVPPPMTGIYIPSGHDKEIDDSQFKYGPKQSKPSESDASSGDFNSCESNSSEETHESMPKPVVNEPKVVSQPKVWSDAPIIEEYESDSDDEHVFVPSKEQEIPINTARTSGTNTVNTARHNFNSQAVPANAARKVNIVKPNVNNARPKTGFHKTLSLFRKPFNITTTLRTNFSNQKVNTVEVNAVSVVGGKRKTTVKPPDYSQRALKNKGIVDSGCSRHMTGNKAHLAEYQDYNGGPVAFGGSLSPRAWYATLSTFLEQSGYRRGTIDKILFIKKDKNDIMLVQVYVDVIIFGSTKRSWCDEFEALMKSIFQMSSMRELTFFLGLHVKQKEDGIFISRDKYVAKILKKFDFASVKTTRTPIKTQKPLVKDEEASDVDVHLYISMISSLMYLTASRPAIMFTVCACFRFQVTPKNYHLLCGG
ncbi:ribonuclease H-like domain-containing protein [Tanacetum coccineum]|uniref:Ribonuclease H-like domain-containing protein n=1 Tax=Tanacetum coccineum TaxID=301880 RepID=A0ABQ5AAN1_9ASTR